MSQPVTSERETRGRRRSDRPLARQAATPTATSTGASAGALAAVLTACPATPDPPHSSETTGDTGASEIPAVCRRWVGCSAEVDPDTAADTAVKYGEGGSCWQADDAEQAGCIAFCDHQLRSYGKAFPELAACRFDDIVGTVEFTLGEAVFDPDDPMAEPTFRALADGDEIKVVRGGQGLLMLPLGVHGTGFEVAADPKDWEDPRTPHINLWVDIEGFNIGFGGHFARIPDYPIGFVAIDDAGTLEHLYIVVFVPDQIEDPAVLFGKHGTIRAELMTYMQPTAALELGFVVASELQEL